MLSNLTSYPSDDEEVFFDCLQSNELIQFPETQTIPTLQTTTENFGKQLCSNGTILSENRVQKPFSKLSHPNVDKTLGAKNFQRSMKPQTRHALSYFTAKRWINLYPAVLLPKKLTGPNKKQHYRAYLQWVRRSAHVTQITDHPMFNGLPHKFLNLEEQTAMDVWDAVVAYMNTNGWNVGSGVASIVAALTTIIHMVRYKTCTTELVISVIASLASVVCSGMPLIQGAPEINANDVTKRIVEALSGIDEQTDDKSPSNTAIDLDLVNRALDCNARATPNVSPTESLKKKFLEWRNGATPIEGWMKEYSHYEVLKAVGHPYPEQCGKFLDQQSCLPDKSIYSQIYREALSLDQPTDILWTEKIKQWEQALTVPTHDLEEQSSDTASTVVSIFVLIAATIGTAAAFSAWKPLKEIPASFNMVKSMVNGGGTMTAVKDFVSTKFFGELSDSDKTSLLIQESLDELKKYSQMDITKYCMESDLLPKFDMALKKMRETLATLPRGHSLHHHVTNSILEGEKKFCEFKLLVESTGHKQVPTCFLFSGIAGIGKSSARIKMASLISPHPAYTVDSRDKYWPQYIGQPVMSVQEFASVASSEKDLVVTALNSIISTAPFNADSAFVKQQPLRVTTVLLDTNTSAKDILDHSGLIKSSYAAFMERIVWLECVWRGPKESLLLERERRPFKSDMSHISFIPNRNVEPFDVPRKINWLPYVFPREYTNICMRYNASLPSILDPNGIYEPRILHSVIADRTIQEWLDFGLTFNHLVTYEAVLRAEHAKRYRALLGGDKEPTPINLQEQADNKHSILLYGPPGAGKSYAVQKFIDSVSANPLIKVIRKDHATSADTRKINIYIIDDLIPEDPVARADEELKWMEIYNSSPPRSLFITCTNLEPKISRTNNFFDFNADYYWGHKDTYVPLFQEPGMYRRIGYSQNFENSPNYPNHYCYEVRQRSVTRVSTREVCTNPQLLREWTSLINKTVSESGEINITYVSAVPKDADLTLIAPSYEGLMAELTPTGIIAIKTGLSNVKISCSNDHLKEFQDVTTSTFRPPVDATLEESAIHFASIVRSRGFTRTVLVELGNSHFYLRGNEFMIVRNVVPDDVSITSDTVVIGKLSVPILLAVKLAFYADSIQISDMVGFPVEKCGEVIATVLRHREDPFIKKALTTENQSRWKLAQLSKMEKFSTFMKKYGLWMLFGTVAVAGLITVVSLMIPKKADLQLVHCMVSEGDLSLYEGLSSEDKFSYIGKYGSPILAEQARRNKQATTNRNYIKNGKFHYERNDGVWREYDANTKRFIRSGTMAFDGDTPVFNAFWYEGDSSANENSTTRKLKNPDRLKYRANYQDSAINFDEQMVAEAYASDISLANKMNVLERNMVNVYGSKGACYGIAVANHFVLCPYHAITENMHISFIDNGKTSTIPVIGAKRVGSQDLAILQLPPNTRSFPDITKHITSGNNSYMGSNLSLMLMRDRKDSIATVAIGCKVMNEFKEIIANGKNITCSASMVLQAKEGTQKGDCGSPYFLDCERRDDGYLYALHTHGDPTKLQSAAAMFNRGSIINIINQLIAETPVYPTTPEDSSYLNQAIKSVNKSSTPLVKTLPEQDIELNSELKLCVKGQYRSTTTKPFIHDSQYPKAYHKHTPALCLCEYKNGIAIAHHNFPNARTTAHFGYALPGKALQEQLMEFVSGTSSTPAHMEFEHISVVNVLPMPVIKHKKTSYKQTPYYDIAVEIFGDPGKIPVEKGIVSEVGAQNLAKNALGEHDQMYHQLLYADLPEAIPPPDLDRFTDALSEHFRNIYGEYLIVSGPGVGVSGVNEVTCPDFPELHGSLRGLEMNTSAGFVGRWAHHRHLKGDYLETRGAQRRWRDDLLSQGMKSYVDYQRQRLYDGKDIFTIFTSSLKDELLPKEKAWKARLFEVADLTLCCLTREVFGLYLARTNSYKADEHSKVGMDPLIDWDSFEKYHRQFKHGWTGDFSRWDKRAPAWLIEMYGTMLAKASSDEIFKKTVGPLMRAHSKSFRCAQNLLLEMNGGVPSGTPLTANMNSDLIFMLMFICFCVLTGTCDMALFLENVLVSVYGDDLRVSISEGATSYFTLRKVASILATFGIILESDRKDGTIYDYTTDFSECGFISRYPRKIKDTWVGALKKISITAPLYWEKERLQPHQFWEICRNTFQEACMWNEEFGAQVLKFISRVCNSFEAIALNRNIKPTMTLLEMRKFLEIACFTKRSANCLIFEQSNVKSSTMSLSIKILATPLDTYTSRVQYLLALGADPTYIASHQDDPLFVYSLTTNGERIFYMIDRQFLVTLGDSVGLAIYNAMTYALTIDDIDPALGERVAQMFTCLINVVDIAHVPDMDLEEQMKMPASTPSMAPQTSATPAGSSTGRMMNINDGVVNDQFLHAPSDTMTLNNTVDSQFQEMGSALIIPNSGIQSAPVDYDYDAWTSFWSGSFQFVERAINGAETRNAVILNISTDPNSPRFPGGDSAELQLVKGFIAGHGFSIPHYIIKMAITGTEGLAGRMMFVQVPAGYAWIGTTPTAEEISASGLPYTTLSFSRDQAHVMELKPIVNSGFANATNAADQVASYTDFYGIIETSLQQSFSENPPIATFKAYLQFGSDFRFTTPRSNFLRIVQSAVVPTPQRRLINIFNSAAEFVLNDVNVVIGSRLHSLAVDNPAIAMKSDLPVELVGGVGVKLSSRDYGLYTYLSTYAQNEGNVLWGNSCDVFASRGFYIPTNNTTFYETGNSGRFINENGPVIVNYPEVYEIPLNEFKAFEWSTVTPDENFNDKLKAYLSPYGDKIYVCRNAAGCVVILPTGISLETLMGKNLDSLVFSANWSTNYNDNYAPYISGAGISLGTGAQHRTYMITPSEAQEPQSLIAVTPPPLVVPAPLTSSASNTYQPITFAKGTPTFSTPIGSGAFPAKAHNDAYLWALNRMGGATSLNFNLTEPNGSVLAYVRFDPTHGFQVNSTQEFVQLTNPGPLLITNVTTSSIVLTPTEPRTFKSILAPSKSLIKRVTHTPKLNLEEQMLSVGAGLLGGLGSGLNQINTNDQNAKDRDLKRYLAEGDWQNQLDLNKMSQENRLAYAGLTNVNQMMNGNRPSGATTLSTPYVNSTNIQKIVDDAQIEHNAPSSIIRGATNAASQQQTVGGHQLVPNISSLHPGATPVTPTAQQYTGGNGNITSQIQNTQRGLTRVRPRPNMVSGNSMGNLRTANNQVLRRGGNLTTTLNK